MTGVQTCALPICFPVTIPFMYNGSFVREGDEIDMNEDRAVNHMRAGDVERDEELIQKIKDRRTAAAQAAIADAGGDW